MRTHVRTRAGQLRNRMLISQTFAGLWRFESHKVLGLEVPDPRAAEPQKAWLWLHGAQREDLGPLNASPKVPPSVVERPPATLLLPSTAALPSKPVLQVPRHVLTQWFLSLSFLFMQVSLLPQVKKSPKRVQTTWNYHFIPAFLIGPRINLQ